MNSNRKRDFFGSASMVGLALLIVFSSAVSAHAEDDAKIEAQSVKENSLGLSLLKNAEYDVHIQGGDCPRGRNCELRSVLTLTFNLNGCVDELGPVSSYKYQKPNGNWVVVVAAYNLTNPDSARVFCAAMPRATIDILLVRGGLTRNNVEVKFTSKNN